MKHIDLYYKHSSLTPKDEREVQLNGLINEYGYNFGGEEKRNISDDVFLKHKMIVNKDFLNSKR